MPGPAGNITRPPSIDDSLGGERNENPKVRIGLNPFALALTALNPAFSRSPFTPAPAPGFLSFRAEVRQPWGSGSGQVCQPVFGVKRWISAGKVYVSRNLTTSGSSPFSIQRTSRAPPSPAFLAVFGSGKPGILLTTPPGLWPVDGAGNVYVGRLHNNRNRTFSIRGLSRDLQPSFRSDGPRQRASFPSRCFSGLSPLNARGRRPYGLVARLFYNGRIDRFHNPADFAGTFHHPFG